MDKTQLAVGFDRPESCHKAKALALKLGLPLSNEIMPRLQVQADKLVLLMAGFNPLSADFSSNVRDAQRRAGKNYGIVRACKPVPGLKIIDATAGWGKDAAILASFGAQICMIERNPVMAALLEDAMTSMHVASSLSDLLILVQGDAKAYLNALKPCQFPDVIYLDPMHPVREKSALVKKNMQVLQNMLGFDNDAIELLKLSLTRTKSKVVVKWPNRLKPLLKPHYFIPGKTIRFDVYTNSQ